MDRDPLKEFVSDPLRNIHITTIPYLLAEIAGRILELERLRDEEREA